MMSIINECCHILTICVVREDYECELISVCEPFVKDWKSWFGLLSLKEHQEGRDCCSKDQRGAPEKAKESHKKGMKKMRGAWWCTTTP